jgi:hypothetical protein
MVIYSDRLYAKLLRFGYDAGYFCIPLVPKFGIISISLDCRHQVSLLRHEERHKEHHRRWPFTYALKILFDKKFKYWAELDCYTEQLRWVKVDMLSQSRCLNIFADYLANNYGFKKTVSECRKDLIIMCKNKNIDLEGVYV